MERTKDEIAKVTVEMLIHSWRVALGAWHILATKTFLLLLHTVYLSDRPCIVTRYDPFYSLLNSSHLHPKLNYLHCNNAATPLARPHTA